MQECKKCGAKLRKTDLYCSRCGAKIAQEEKKPVEEKTGKKKIELSEEAKQRLKKELEIAIGALKRGEITIEEFQSIKKAIAAKAKAGYYTQPAPTPEPKKPEPKPETPRAEQVLPLPPKREESGGYSKLWLLAPVLLNILGGALAYLALRRSNEKAARKMLALGVGSLILVSGGVYYGVSKNLLFPKPQSVSQPTIVIEGEGIVEPSGEEAINATNASAEEMNLKLKDLGGGFTINPLLTGVLKDPLELAGGNRSLAQELESNGWLENHRLVAAKEFTLHDEKRNLSITEMEIDSSISKFDAEKASKSYFREQLARFREGLQKANYTLTDLAVNESGVMGKKVEPDPEFEIKVTYRIFFYKRDATVSLLVTKRGRGLTEEEVEGYARKIEKRIK